MKNDFIKIIITVVLVLVLVGLIVKNSKRTVKNIQDVRAKTLHSDILVKDLSKEGNATEARLPGSGVGISGESLYKRLEDRGVSVKRDPFSELQIKEPDDTSHTTLNLSGVLWDAAAPLAVINNRIVKVGDVVNGNKIIEIKPDRVILSNGAKEYELKLEK